MCHPNSCEQIIWNDEHSLIPMQTSAILNKSDAVFRLKSQLIHTTILITKREYPTKKNRPTDVQETLE